ncbi:MAG TPA: hypothetical protein DGH68_03595, partial [Bacteroidetes bacterium]|nr:hypothetical protein [Bacteroidota bacterium]
MTNPTRTRNDAAVPKRGTSRSSSDRRQSILALLLMAVAVLIFLALVSYDAGDEAAADVRFSDLVKVFSGDPQVQAKADTAQNWLGLVGAVLSDFLIKSTIGYSIFFLPILLLLFGWTLLRRGDFHRLIVLTNYTLTSALLLSTSFGMLRLIFGQEVISMPWSGVVGDFLATILARLLGRAGGSILLFTALLSVAVLAIDLDLHQTVERLKRWALLFMDWFARKRDSWHEARLARAEQMEESRHEPETPPPPKPKSVVRIAKPPLEEPIAAVKKAEILPPRKAQPEAEENEEVENERIPQLTNQRQKELRLEIEKPVREEEVDSDVPPVPARASNVLEEIDYVFPSVELLDPPRPGKEDVDDDELKANAALLRDTLAEFDVEVESVSVTPGPVVTLYELVPAVGVKISRIVSLENDIALKLAAKGIRIMAPIPGKSAVGVEIPNNNRALVTIRS